MSDEAIGASHNTVSPTAKTQHLLSQLHEAAEALANTRTMDHEKRIAASATAHHLAHAMEQEGISEAANKAQEIIATLDHEGLPQPERLQQQVHALTELLKR